MTRGQAFFLCATAAIWLPWAEASAQDAPNPQQPPVTQSAPGNSATPSDDIVVTARRRSESVLDVPLSVAAFSEKMLDTKGVKTIADLSRIVPSLTFTPSWAGSSTISIRGISSSIGAGTTGVYIDDTPIQVRALGAGATSTNAYPAIFDLARVEVLRGPQGTLFGAGSEGGTVRFISPDPGFTEYTGYGRAEIATTESGAPSYEAGAAIGGPLIDDRVAFRLSAFHRRDGGWVDRAPYPGDVITQRNTNSVDTTVLRGALAIKVADNFKLTPSVYYQDIKRNDSFQYWRGLSDPAHQRFLNGQPLKQPGKDRFELYSLKGEYDLPGINIISNTSFFIRHNPSVADYSHYVSELIGGDYNNSLDVGVIAPATMRNDQHVFTQELRIQSDSGKNARLNWVLGFFYQNARQRADESVAVSDLNALSQALFGLTPTEAFGQDNLPGNVSYFGKDTARDRQIALFGQVDYKILSSLTLTLGARVARTRFNFTNSQGGPFNGGPTGSSGKHAETPVTPKIGLNFKPNDDLLLYASAARGFRTGGANAPVPTASCIADLNALGIAGAPHTYNSDSVWSYEVGSKGSFARHAVEVEASAFYIDWRNIQNSINLNSCGFSYVANLGSARSRGFDARLTARPVTGLTLDVAIAYTDARYSQTILGAPVAGGGRGVIVAKGDKLATPPWNVSIGADYQFPLEGGGTTAYVHGDYDYKSSYDQGDPATVSFDPFTSRSDATNFVSARIGVRKGGWDLSLFVQNLLNSTDTLSITHDTIGSSLLRDTSYRPRTMGATVSLRY